MCAGLPGMQAQLKKRDVPPKKINHRPRRADERLLSADSQQVSFLLVASVFRPSVCTVHPV